MQFISVYNTLASFALGVYTLYQCFSTFLASSPGSGKFFELLSRSKFFCNDYVPVFYIVSSKRVRVIQVLLRLFPNLFLFLTKFKNPFLIYDKLSKIRFSKIFQVPGFKFRYRDVPAVEKHCSIVYRTLCFFVFQFFCC